MFKTFTKKLSIKLPKAFEILHKWQNMVTLDITEVLFLR